MERLHFESVVSTPGARGGTMDEQDPAKSRLPEIAPRYSWQYLYLTAVLETDRSKLRQLAVAAEAVINDRKKQLAQDHQGTPEERRAIEDALASLKILRSDAK